jgi:hypothetical protein
MSRPRPKIPQDVLDDAARDAISEDIFGTERLRKLSSRIRRRQRRLRALVGADAWRAYLQVEEASNERLGKALADVARVAFEAGLKAGRGGS